MTHGSNQEEGVDLGGRRIIKKKRKYEKNTGGERRERADFVLI
jgi:hypothetical protein